MEADLVIGLIQLFSKLLTIVLNWQRSYSLSILLFILSQSAMFDDLPESQIGFILKTDKPKMTRVLIDNNHWYDV
jgi:hypothetical protein